jgi:hypothetical protein
LVFIVKLFLSAATLGFAVGYAARRRANWLHRRTMPLAVALLWVATAVLVAGRAGLGLPARPAFWVVELTGGEAGAAVAGAIHQWLGLLVLLGLTGQAVLGRIRHPLHRPLAWVVLPWWLAIWVTAMFGYV